MAKVFSPDIIYLHTFPLSQARQMKCIYVVMYLESTFFRYPPPLTFLEPTIVNEFRM
jgi:hypothetical protein